MTRASGISRRDILKRSATTTIAAAGVAALAGVGSNFAFAQGSDKLRIGLVGCGGRGTGAAQDSLSSNDNVELVAMGDLFPDRLESSRQRLREKLADKVKVSDDHCHTGFDAYHKVIDSGVDLVIFATPPAFRPIHIAAAVEAGKHVFAEKPIATDPAGIRSVLESARKIKEKRLGFVCGTQRRHDVGYNEIIKRIHDGAIGELVSGNCYWNQGYLWMHPRQPGWSDMEWQVRNWLYFTWLSGDHICEQHVHNIDVMNWCFDAHPVSAYGMGGRQVRTDPAYGDIFDHFAIEFTYPNGARITSQCRQIDGTDGRVKEHIVGTKGTSDPSGSISGSSKFRYKRPAGALGPYQQEHRDLIDSIRKGQPLNEAQRIAESTLTAIMGRMSAYTGKEVTWEQALNSKLSLLPEKFELGKLPVAPVAEPGKTPLV
jgi:predicted dehydrogenase